MVTDDGMEVGFHGEFREIVPNERIVSTEVYEGFPEGRRSTPSPSPRPTGARPSRSSCSTRARSTGTLTSTPGWRRACRTRWTSWSRSRSRFAERAPASRTTGTPLPWSAWTLPRTPRARALIDRPGSAGTSLPDDGRRRNDEGRDPGIGEVAQTLGAGFLAHGHEVTMGTRDPGKLATGRRRTPRARSGPSPTRRPSARCSCWRSRERRAGRPGPRRGGEPRRQAGARHDESDRRRAPENGVLHFFTDLDDSLMERLSASSPARASSSASARSATPAWSIRTSAAAAHDVHLR